MEAHRMTTPAWPKKLPGRVSIVRRSDGKILLQVEDEKSGSHVMEALMDPRDFGNAVTGLSVQPATCTWFDAPIGKRREVRTIDIELPEGIGTKAGDVVAVQRMRLHESDGWLGYEPDLFNPHRHTRREGATFASVSFHRYAEDPPQ